VQLHARALFGRCKVPRIGERAHRAALQEPHQVAGEFALAVMQVGEPHALFLLHQRACTHQIVECLREHGGRDRVHQQLARLLEQALAREQRVPILGR